MRMKDTWLIALYSSEARSGKGTAARVLVDEYGYTERQFSAPIKAAWKGLMEYVGLEDMVELTLEGGLKEVPLSEVGGLSFRKFGEHIGNGLRADMPDLWVSILRERLLKDYAAARQVVISDMRYPNEIELIRSLGGITIRVCRADGYTRGFKQPSEGRLDTYNFDHTLRATSPEALEHMVRSLI